MHLNLKGTSHEDSHEIATIIRVHIHQLRLSKTQPWEFYHHAIIKMKKKEVDERWVWCYDVCYNITLPKAKTLTWQTSLFEFLYGMYVIKKVAWLVWYHTDDVKIGMSKNLWALLLTKKKKEKRDVLCLKWSSLYLWVLVACNLVLNQKWRQKNQALSHQSWTRWWHWWLKNKAQTEGSP